MKKILFVNNESLSEANLQQLLYPLRYEWELMIVNSDQTALEKLSTEPFDVIITDMKKPGPEGTQLLAKVCESYPHLIRIVLSDNADEHLTLEAVNFAHQYLAKPCNPEVLKHALEKVCVQRNLLQNDALQRLVSQLPSLPLLPSLYSDLTRELASPESSMERIGHLISQDVGMTAKVLQIANSALFGLQREVSYPKDAAFFLGTEALVAIVLSLHAFTQLRPSRLLRLKHEALWSHSLQIGQLAKKLAKAEKQSQSLCNEVFTAGLLHEVGILILAAKMPRMYAEVERIVGQENLSLVEAEQLVFGVGHPEVGAYLLGLWGLPKSLVETVAFHHAPSRCPAQTTFTALTAVHIADSLIEETPARDQRAAQLTSLDHDYIAQLGLSERLPAWQEKWEAKEPAYAKAM